MTDLAEACPVFLCLECAPFGHMTTAISSSLCQLVVGIIYKNGTPLAAIFTFLLFCGLNGVIPFQEKAKVQVLLWLP